MQYDLTKQLHDFGIDKEKFNVSVDITPVSITGHGTQYQYFYWYFYVYSSGIIDSIIRLLNVSKSTNQYQLSENF